MGKFCRHGTLSERCPICHANVEAAARAVPSRAGAAAPRSRSGHKPGVRSRLVVRHELRAEDDGYRSPLAPGLRATADAVRLAEEIAFAAGRLAGLESDPPGLYAEVAAGEIEEATWLALLIAYVGPLESGQPFASIEAARCSWGATPVLAEAEPGARGSLEPGRTQDTISAYLRFAERAGSQEQAIIADASWSPQQRFERIQERLSLPGLHRRARYDLLVTLGRLGRYELSAPGLLLTEEDAVTLAAKRVFGIGDRLTLERRSRELAAAASVAIEALDLGLENWARSDRITQGFHDESSRGEAFAAAERSALERATAALRC